MTQLTPEQWLSKNSSKPESTTTRVTSKKVQTPEEWLKDPQINPEKKSTLGKVAGFLAPTTTKTLSKFKKGEDITARDVVGSALEVGSYLIPAGAIARGVGLGIKGAGLASKVANGVATGAVSGGMFEAGGSISDGGTSSDIAKRTLTGAAFGGVAGGVVGAIGGGLAARKLTKTKLAEETLAKTEPVTPQEFVAQAKEKTIVPKQELPNTKKVNLIEGLQDQSTLIKNQPVTPQESVAIAKAKKEGVPYVAPVEQPSLLPDTPEVMVRKEKAFEDLNNTQPANTPFEAQTNKEQLNVAALDSARLEDVVFNNAPPMKGSNRNAYLSYIKQLAEEQTRNGDSTLAKKIINSGITKDVSGTLAQGLQASQLVGRDNIINVLERFKNEMAEKLPRYTKNNSVQEVSAMKEEVKKLYSKLENETITPEDLGDIVKSIICK
jgi:hypothetical protein